MKRWPTIPLGEVCFAKSGNSKIIKGTLPTENDGTLFPAYSATGQDVFSDAFDFDGEGVIISAVGARCGKCFLASGKWRAIANTHVVLPKPDKANVRFLWYLLNDESFWVKGGTAQPFVKVGDSLKKLIAVPPLAEQERIVKLLDEADELRKLRAQADQRTSAIIPALFHEMFGDPVYSFPKSTLGELVLDFRYGTSNKSTGEGKPALRIPNVVKQAVNLDDLKFVPVSNSDFERLQLKDGDLLFVRTNGNPDYVGRCAVFNVQDINAAGYDASEFIYASYLIRARLQIGKVLPLFIQYFLATSEGRHELRSRSKTSAGQFNINTEGLGTLPILVPPLLLQKEFAQRVSEIRELEAKQAASRQRLDDLFQSMLHRAFSGEL